MFLIRVIYKKSILESFIYYFHKPYIKIEERNQHYYRTLLDIDYVQIVIKYYLQGFLKWPDEYTSKKHRDYILKY